MRYLITPSPVGNLTLSSDGDSLTGLFFDNHRGFPTRDPSWIEDDRVSVLVDAAAQLAQYFAGDRTTFDLPLRAIGTDFQLKVWEQLRLIPHGETISYGELARRVGNPAASRAVGMANGRNPISIIVPCHRVIGANGTLTGFGGGVETKHRLLTLERGTGYQPVLGFAQEEKDGLLAHATS